LRHTLSQPERAGQALLTGGIALIISIVYLLTRNLWLCLLIHLGIEMGVLRLWGRVR
jgi:hypothetical protein